jgi:phosphopantothenoylcysteine decarboxylase/phosphopantothenate--cysteine ligase
MHPSFEIKGKVSNSLLGRRIVLGVTGSIAAVRAIELARSLIRRGADVYAVMSESARRIIHPDALHYATGHEVTCEITGGVEHILFFGEHGEADLFLIAPCTANTIGKIASGIDDTPVTTFASTALGSSIPIMIVPAMHESMYKHSIVMENIDSLNRLGITFVGPRLEERIAKIAEEEEIVINVERALSQHLLEGKRILITSGKTSEQIDPIRIITNRSSGRTGVEIAKEAFRQDADVALVHNGSLGIHGIREIHAESASEMIDVVLSELSEGISGYDILICAAAIFDFTVEKHNNKIKSDHPVELKLVPTGKLISEVRAKFPELKIVGFKAEVNVSQEELISSARSLMRAHDLGFVVANDVGRGGIGTVDNDVFIVNDDVTRVKGSKSKIAKEIIKVVSNVI